MKIYSLAYVHLCDVLTPKASDVLNSDDLPWTFGDCHASLITIPNFLDWLDAQDEIPKKDHKTIRTTLSQYEDCLLLL